MAHGTTIYRVASNTPAFTYRAENTGDAAPDLGAGIRGEMRPAEYVSGDDGSGLIQPGQTWVYECVTTLVGTTTALTATVTGVEPRWVDASRPATTPRCVVRVRHRDQEECRQAVVEPGRSAYTYSVINTRRDGVCPTCGSRRQVLAGDVRQPVTRTRTENAT